MLTKNVTYNERPESFEIRRSGSKAVVVFTTDIQEIEVEEPMEQGSNGESGLPEIGGSSHTVTRYLAENVYSLETNWTPNLAERVNANYNAWLAKAMIPIPSETTLPDVIEALNTLTEIVLGGE